MKIIASIVGILLLVSCASTNLKIIDVSDSQEGRNAIHYHCAPMQITVFHDNQTTAADLFIEFKKIGKDYKWFITLDCSQVQSTWTELKSVKLEFDNTEKTSAYENIIHIDSNLILNNPTTHTNSFFVNNDFLKKIIHAHGVMITARCNEQEAFINLAQPQINQIGMFYQYIQRNVLNNASVIII